MVEAITKSLTTIGLLGIVLAIITLANVALGTVYNVGVLKKPFEFKKFLFGFLKAIVIYVGVGLLTAGAAALPVVIEECQLTSVISPDAIKVFSVTSIATMILTVIITQAKGAIQNLLKLVGIGAETLAQKTYKVEDEQESN